MTCFGWLTLRYLQIRPPVIHPKFHRYMHTFDIPTARTHTCTCRNTSPVQCPHLLAVSYLQSCWAAIRHFLAVRKRDVRRQVQLPVRLIRVEPYLVVPSHAHLTAQPVHDLRPRRRQHLQFDCQTKQLKSTSCSVITNTLLSEFLFQFTLYAQSTVNTLQPAARMPQAVLTFLARDAE